MTYDFKPHIAGDTWTGITSIKIQVSGVPVDLTDSKIYMQVKPEENIASPFFCSFSSETGSISILNPAVSGQISILPTIIDIPPGMYQYYLNIEFPSGIKKTYLKGSWEILSNMSI